MKFTPPAAICVLASVGGYMGGTADLASSRWCKPDSLLLYCTINPAHAVPLASARQHPENQKENQAGHSSERTVEGHYIPGVVCGVFWCVVSLLYSSLFGYITNGFTPPNLPPGFK